MTDNTEPLTSVSISVRRDHIVTETAALRFDDDIEELCLSDLRGLIEAAAHIPGRAAVRLRTNGIDIEYVEHPIEPDVEFAEAIDAPGKEDPDPESYTIVDSEVVHELALAVQEQQHRDEGKTPAAPESAPAVTGDNALVDDVRRLVTQIKEATGWTTAAIAELAQVPPSSLVTIMAPSYKYRSTRRSTYDKLRAISDELVAEQAEPTVDGPEDAATDRSRDEQIGVAG